ncbi:hypothetical protein [Geodermatophilus sp. SYSU D00815]
MFLLALLVPAFLVVVAGYTLGSVAFGWLGPQKAEVAGWITGLALLTGVGWGVVTWRRRRGRRR